MQEPDLEENALTARVTDGRLMIERRFTEAAPPGQVIVADPDGKTETVELHEDSPDARRRPEGDGAWRLAGVQGQQAAYAAAGAANPLSSLICGRPPPWWTYGAGIRRRRALACWRRQ